MGAAPVDRPEPALRDRVVVLTGASHGLGSALVDAFAAAGARLVLAARRAGDLLERAEAEPDRIAAVTCDVRSAADREQLLTTAVSTFGRVDVLVNNAGFARSAPALEETEGDISRTLTTNLLAPFALCRLVAAVMREQGHGSIVNVSSVSAFAVTDRYPLASYASSKAALVALTRELAAQWGRFGVRVNAVAPGWFPTRMNGFLADPDQARWVALHTSLGRPGRLPEITGPVVFLASEESSYVTGHVLRVDGGWF